ncbi:hypothetical protein HAX54_034696 [Datura stramonium]|uniref:Uncharacterized protein n=1 Tax=Datura stramonium TaxID=4076 RepID=A0ABS8VFW2_DATST|nr:hypothetical protein [Datura stramonium]
MVARVGLRREEREKKGRSGGFRQWCFGGVSGGCERREGGDRKGWWWRWVSPPAGGGGLLAKGENGGVRRSNSEGEREEAGSVGFRRKGEKRAGGWRGRGGR